METVRGASLEAKKPQEQTQPTRVAGLTMRSSFVRVSDF
jgi:hypothetical protein